MFGGKGLWVWFRITPSPGTAVSIRPAPVRLRWPIYISPTGAVLLFYGVKYVGKVECYSIVIHVQHLGVTAECRAQFKEGILKLKAYAKHLFN